MILMSLSWRRNDIVDPRTFSIIGSYSMGYGLIVLLHHLEQEWRGFYCGISEDCYTLRWFTFSKILMEIGAHISLRCASVGPECKLLFWALSWHLWNRLLCNIMLTFTVLLSGSLIFYPCNGSHCCEGICVSIFSHTNQRVQSPGLWLPEETLRCCWCEVSKWFLKIVTRKVVSFFLIFCERI